MNSVQGTTNTLMLGKVRIAGVLCTVGGAGWLVNGVLSSVISQSSVMVLAIADVFWVGIQALLLIGVVGLALSGVAPGWFGGISLGIALCSGGWSWYWRRSTHSSMYSSSERILRFYCRSAR
jgi:hypothetical protein